MCEGQMTNQTDQNNSTDDGSSGIVVIWGGAIATALWFFALAALLAGSPRCADAASGWWGAQFLSCRSANELGDFLAGAFAPVAFLWLVLAVFLQRSELGLQRKELKEARAVATKGAEAANSQAKAAEAQAKLLGGQYQLEILQEKIRGLAMYLQKNMASIPLSHVSGSDYLEETAMPAIWRVSSDHELVVYERGRSLTIGLESLLEENSQYLLERPDVLKAVKDLIDSAIRTAEKENLAKVRANAVGLYEFQETMKKLIDSDLFSPADLFPSD
jgi:hypothetical protein